MKIDNKEQDETLKSLINKEGAFLRDKLDLFFSKNEDFEVFKKEYPISFDGQKRRIDLIFKNRQKGNFENTEIYFVIEVKKLNKDYCGLICFGDQDITDTFGSNLIGANLEHNIKRSWQKKYFSFGCEIPFFTELYKFDKQHFDVFAENKNKTDLKSKKKLDDLTLSHLGGNQSVLQQVYQGIMGFLEKKYFLDHAEFIDNKKRNLPLAKKNIFVIPIIVTNTNILSVNVNMEKYDMYEGNIELSDIILVETPWMGLRYSESVITKKFDFLDSDLLNQDIFIVNTFNLLDLLKNIRDSIFKKEQVYDLLKERKNILGDNLRKAHNEHIFNKSFIDIYNTFFEKNIFGRFRDKHHPNYFEEPFSSYPSFSLKEFEEEIDTCISQDKALFRLAIYLVSMDCVNRRKYISSCNPYSNEHLLGLCFYQHIIDMFEFLKENQSFFSDK